MRQVSCRSPFVVTVCLFCSLSTSFALNPFAVMLVFLCLAAVSSSAFCFCWSLCLPHPFHLIQNPRRRASSVGHVFQGHFSCDLRQRTRPRAADKQHTRTSAAETKPTKKNDAEKGQRETGKGEKGAEQTQTNRNHSCQEETHRGGLVPIQTHKTATRLFVLRAPGPRCARWPATAFYGGCGTSAPQAQSAPLLPPAAWR